MKELLSNAAKRAIRYLESLDERWVFSWPEAREHLTELDVKFPQFSPKDLSDENPSH